MKRVVTLFAFAVACFPVGLFALTSSDLVETHRKWLEEEVVYIITERERGVFLALPSSESGKPSSTRSGDGATPIP